MSDRTVVEWGGVRVDLAHVHTSTRAAMILECDRWIAAGQRPPLLIVKADGVDVSDRPDLWPALYRNYRGLGRLEWVGDLLGG